MLTALFLEKLRISRFKVLTDIRGRCISKAHIHKWLRNAHTHFHTASRAVEKTLKKCYNNVVISS